MATWLVRLAAGAVASAGFLGLFGEKGDTPKKATPTSGKAPPAPAVYTVKEAPFRVRVAVKGVFVASTAAEVSFDPNSWSDLRLGTIVPHGARVKKGDVLMELERKGIDRAIRDMEVGRELAGLALERLEAEVRHLEKTVPLDLEAAKRAKRIADEDLERHETIDRAQSLKSSEFSVKSSRNSLEYAQEELGQLERMYAADDLTEETEEIILKRARNNVERSVFNLERAEIRHDFTSKYDVPRRDEQKEDSAVRRTLDLTKAEGDLPALLTRKKLDLSKMKHDRLRSAERLDELREDREGMVLRAPIDGVVYYGRNVDGVWQKPDPIATSLAQGRKLKSRTVWLTVVRPRPLYVRTSIVEAQRRDVRKGVEGRIVPAVDGTVRLGAAVEEVADVPTPAGTFPVRIRADLGDDSLGLMPGMNCEVRFVPYVAPKAIAVPAKTVHVDDEDDAKHHVYVRTSAGKSEKRAVTVGPSHGGKTEITSGLEAGEKVLLEKPKK